MALPKRRTPRAKQASRRSHHGLALPSLARCSVCRSMHRNHEPCKVCGTYRGRQAIRLDDGSTD